MKRTHTHGQAPRQQRDERTTPKPDNYFPYRIEPTFYTEPVVLDVFGDTFTEIFGTASRKASP